MTDDTITLWAKRVERQRESDLTVAEYAAEIGVDPMTLQRWAQRLRDGSARVVSVTRPRASLPESRCDNPRCGRPFAPHRESQRFCCSRCRQSVACGKWYRKARARGGTAAGAQ